MGFASFQQMLLRLQYCTYIFQQGLRLRLEVKWMNKDFLGIARVILTTWRKGKTMNYHRENIRQPGTMYGTSGTIWNMISPYASLCLCVCLGRCMYNFLRTARSADFGYVTCERWTPLKVFVWCFCWKIFLEGSLQCKLYYTHVSGLSFSLFCTWRENWPCHQHNNGTSLAEMQKLCVYNFVTWK